MITQEKEEHKNEGLPLGWDAETITVLDTAIEVEYLQGKVKALSHQVEVYKLTEKDRMAEAESYRLKLLADDLKEQQKLAELEPVPLLLTRGAHTTGTTPYPTVKNRVHIDWISFSAKETSNILEQFANINIEGLRFEKSKSGMAGYKSVLNISKDGEQIGLIGYGSIHGKNLFTLTGKGCSLIKDWHQFRYWLEKLEDYSITRLDLALDFYMGEVSHDKVIEAYNLDKFRALKSSKNPSISQQQTVDGLGRNRGRTVKIGGRNSSKFIRCYEKGLERFAKLYAHNTKMEDEQIQFFFNNFDCHEIDPENVPEGTSILNWYRLEVQFGNADRILSTEMLTDRDPFFAGSYPYCKEVIEMEESKKPERLPNNLETDIEVMFKHAREQYGSFLTTMRASGKMTDAEILNKLCNGKISQRIIKAGGLDIIKPYSPK